MTAVLVQGQCIKDLGIHTLYVLNHPGRSILPENKTKRNALKCFLELDSFENKIYMLFKFHNITKYTSQNNNSKGCKKNMGIINYWIERVLFILNKGSMLNF